MNVFETKGIVFEFAVTEQLRFIRHLNTISDLRVYSVFLKRETPIDILVVSGNNILVLELKSFNTKLEGNMISKSWNGFSNKRVTSIFNPILQSRSKLRALQRSWVLSGNDLSEINWHSYVIVSTHCAVNSDTTKGDIKTSDELVKFVRGLGSCDSSVVFDKVLKCVR